MIPSVIQILDRLPLTEQGKVDRAALPAPDLDAPAADAYRAPRTPIEVAICDACAAVLGVTQIGLDDQFFARGGDSIMSIQLVGRLRQANVSVTPRDMFQQPTMERLAAVARRVQAEQARRTIRAIGERPRRPSCVGGRSSAHRSRASIKAS